MPLSSHMGFILPVCVSVDCPPAGPGSSEIRALKSSESESIRNHELLYSSPLTSPERHAEGRQCPASTNQRSLSRQSIQGHTARPPPPSQSDALFGSHQGRKKKHRTLSGVLPGLGLPETFLYVRSTTYELTKYGYLKKVKDTKNACEPARTDKTRRPDQTSKQIMSRYNYVLYRLANSVLPSYFVPISPSVAALSPPISHLASWPIDSHFGFKELPDLQSTIVLFQRRRPGKESLDCLVNVAASPSNVVGREPLIVLGNCQQRAPTIVAFLDRRQPYFCCTSPNGPLDCI
ncbi:hypothetical protein CSAL01_05112 [Colletotrichum salicis]|uniref:Uncharacterized protein n=1 Tax=Colletotrichum salicis TaxID=1209931 RepID=A0A135S4V5_9PEZI|nr:hypothetical protein CSAL01_05112 [Colletotrichum salicis]